MQEYLECLWVASYNIVRDFCHDSKFITETTKFPHVLRKLLIEQAQPLLCHMCAISQ